MTASSDEFTDFLRFGGAAPPDPFAALKEKVRRNPLDGAALEELAEAQIAGGRILDGFATYNTRISLGNVSAPTWARIGAAMDRQQEYAQAIACFEQSLSLEDAPEVRHMMGRALFKLGDVDASVAFHESAAKETGNLAAWLAVATLIPGAPAATPASILAARQAFAQVLANSPLANRMKRTPKPRPRTDGPLRVGYVSSWLEKPNYMRPTWALINNHDRAKVEVHLFSDSAEGAEMIGYEPHPTDVIHTTGTLDNTQLGKLICKTGLDILIDINAYSTPERLGIFTQPVAPICLAWQNHFAPSGLPGFHGIVGDEQSVKAGEEGFFNETVHRLPTSYLTFTVAHRAPPVTDPPCLTKGHITFGSLCVQYKLTPTVIDAWSEILKGVPGSKLFLANRTLESGENRVWLTERFAEKGIGTDRLILDGGAEHYDYLKNYDRMDFALDAFPYNGGTTTVEAIWQGVPVLTFDGDRWASRTSASLICYTHLKDFVAPSRQAMIDMAIRMGNDPDTPARLKDMRHGMRDALKDAPVCDGKRMAQSMEALFDRLMDRQTGPQADPA